jgi:hypothetical protein
MWTMAEPWSEDRLDAALFALADVLDVPGGERLVIDRPAARHRRRWPLLVAAAIVLLAIGVVAITPARETVARWFGVHIERDDGATAHGSFVDDVVAIDVDDAIVRAGLAAAALEQTPLGRPDAAGIPPEGGILLAWRDGTTTLWVRPGDDDVVVVKKLIGARGSEMVADLGDYAVLIEGDHVLATPARRVAAGRVLWWLDDGRQWRLESELDTTTMLAVGRALAGS